jgi:FhaA, N-terminal domain/FHA domain
VSNVKARQNPLSKVESFMQRIVESPFAFLFPSKLQPAEIARKLERAMEDSILLQGEGRRLAPDIYDIFLSYKDHQQLQPVEATLKKGWQDDLVQVARHHHYTLRVMPVLRLHASSELRPGMVRIEAQLQDRQHANVSDGTSTEIGPMATQALSAEQLALLRAQLIPGQQLPGLPDAAMPQGSSANNPSSSTIYPGGHSQGASIPSLPQAWLTIRLPQMAQKVYHIEKTVVNIGRQLTNDIIVEDKRVSRYHAQIKYQPNGQFTIFDLGSTNGITINGTPHLRHHTLRSGDRFTIGSYDFYFERR